MIEPVSISVAGKKMTVPAITQHYMELHESQKFDVLCRILDIQSPDMAIVFGRTKKRVDEIQEGLAKRGYSARGLHGDLDQSKRDSVMKQFKDGTIQVLVATDVAARGLDISGVTHVYNFDIPQDSERYVHRIGRTGRAGKSGMSVTFVTAREFRLLKIIEKVTGQRMIRLGVPTIDDAIKKQQKLVIDKLMSVAESKDAMKYAGLAEMILNESDSVTMLAAALKLLIKEPDSTEVSITSIEPSKRKDKAFGQGHRRDSYQGQKRDDRQRENSSDNDRNDSRNNKKVYRRSYKEYRGERR
jgi:ATP-dependent RNA helicase DeaD